MLHYHWSRSQRCIFSIMRIISACNTATALSLLLVYGRVWWQYRLNVKHCLLISLLYRNQAWPAPCMHRTACTKNETVFTVVNSHIKHLCRSLWFAFRTIPACLLIDWENNDGPLSQFHHNVIVVYTKIHWFRKGLLDKPVKPIDLWNLQFLLWKLVTGPEKEPASDGWIPGSRVMMQIQILSQLWMAEQGSYSTRIIPQC